ncbi:CBS domain-containing protein [Ectothiorhodospiraceae bacterium WFHF3C12]|nr:CBS domain-containing protein [Ectothiorhodospiraceae bacterium WFHF3C12]
MLRVTPGSSVAEAVRLMNERNTGSVLVMEEDGTLIGIFTERDVLRRVIDGHLDYDSTAVSDVMSRDVACIRGNTTVEEALVIVNSRNCRHLPVIDNERVVGVISVRDLINSVVRDQEHRITELTDYISGNYGRNARIQ